MKTPGWISSLYHTVSDAVLENRDGCAAGRRRYIISTWCSGLITYLITGIYFTSLLLAAGADDIFIGYITMATTFCGFMQIFSPLIFERMARRKPLLLTLRSLYHLLNIVVIGIIPLLPIGKMQMLGAFMVTVILLNLINSFCASGLSIWMMQAVPSQKHTVFFTVMNFGSTVISVMTEFLGGRLLDVFEAEEVSINGITPTISAILVMRVFALIIAILDISASAGIPEKPYQRDAAEENNHGILLLLLPLKNRAFMLTISIMLVRNFATALPGNFYTVYLIDNVQMSYTLISLCSMIGIPLALIMTPVWSMWIRKYKWSMTLAIAIFGYSFAYFFNLPVTKENPYVYILIPICIYFFNPCIGIQLSYLPYTNMPNTNRTAYLSFYAFCGTIASLVGNYVGILFMKLTEGKAWTVFGFTMINRQYIMTLPFVLLMLLSLWILFVGKYVKIQNFS